MIKVPFLAIFSLILFYNSGIYAQSCNGSFPTERDPVYPEKSTNFRIINETDTKAIDNLKKTFTAAQCNDTNIQTWNSEVDQECLSIVGQPIDTQLDETFFVTDNIKPDQLKEQKENIKKLKSCYNKILEGLALEETRRQAQGAVPTNHLEDKDTLASAIGNLNKIEARLDFWLGTEPATKQAQREELNKIENFGDIFSTKDWIPVFNMGIKIMPEYDETGRNQGFRESAGFMNFNFDVRGESSLEDLLFDGKEIYHFGVNIEFSSEPVACQTNTNSEEEGANASEQPDSCSEPDPEASIKELSFNDVADTLEASIYTWVHPYIKNNSEVGIGLRYGFLNREQLQTDGDSINDFKGYGLRYVYNDFKSRKSISNENFKNGRPLFFIEAFKLSYEDFAATGQKANRIMVRAGYRLFDDKPIYLGLTTNGGEGPDDIALTISYGLKVEGILDSFN